MQTLNFSHVFERNKTAVIKRICGTFENTIFKISVQTLIFRLNNKVAFQHSNIHRGTKIKRIIIGRFLIYAIQLDIIFRILYEPVGNTFEGYVCTMIELLFFQINRFLYPEYLGSDNTCERN